VSRNVPSVGYLPAWSLLFKYFVFISLQYIGFFAKLGKGLHFCFNQEMIDAYCICPDVTGVAHGGCATITGSVFVVLLQFKEMTRAEF